MNSIKRKLLIITLLAVMTVSMTGCNLFNTLFGVDDGGGEVSGQQQSQKHETLDLSKDISEEEEMEIVNNGIVYEEETDGADLHFRKSSDLEYIGKWAITSGNAIYMYGNLELNILPAGKWTGMIVDEKVSGKWTFDKNKMHLTSEILNADLAFTDGGKLVMQEDRGIDGEEDIVTVVLSRVED